jgi:hypothetical protein
MYSEQVSKGGKLGQVEEKNETMALEAFLVPDRFSKASWSLNENEVILYGELTGKND